MLTMHVLYRLSYGGSPERGYDNPVQAAVRKEKGGGFQRQKAWDRPVRWRRRDVLTGSNGGGRREWRQRMESPC